MSINTIENIVYFENVSVFPDSITKSCKRQNIFSFNEKHIGNPKANDDRWIKSIII